MKTRGTRVAFADAALLDAFTQLSSGKFEEQRLAGHIRGAIDALKRDPFSGVAIQKKLWPKRYVKDFAVDNLRKIDLPDGWRLIYTLQGNEVEIISIILEWFSHKDYEKRFGYRVR